MLFRLPHFRLRRIIYEFFDIFRDRPVSRTPWNNGILPRALSREWIFSHINGPVASDSWTHRSRTPRIHSSFRGIILEWAWRDYPLYLPPRLIAQFAPAFSAISHLCVSLNGWDLLPPIP